MMTAAPASTRDLSSLRDFLRPRLRISRSALAEVKRSSTKCTGTPRRSDSVVPTQRTSLVQSVSSPPALDDSRESRESSESSETTRSGAGFKISRNPAA